MSSGLRWTEQQLAALQSRKPEPMQPRGAIILPDDATEAQHQDAVFAWAESMAEVHPGLECMYAIPNEGKRSGRTGQAMKRRGLRPGFPDICLPLPRGMFAALFIELKRPDGSLKADQYGWQQRLARHGNKSVVCWSAESARLEILNYLSLGVT